jgi:hypothetical protein
MATMLSQAHRALSFHGDNGAIADMAPLSPMSLALSRR